MGYCLSIRRRRPRPKSESSGVPTHNAQAFGIDDPNNECAKKMQQNKNLDLRTSYKTYLLPQALQHTDEIEEIVITSIRARDVTLGLRRFPAGFYTLVHHSGVEWRTEIKGSSVNDDVKWSGPISLPSDPSATVCIEVYGSFEFQPMLGAGEQLRHLTITIRQLLDHSATGVPFIFLPMDGDVVSPCSSLLVTVERRNCESIDPSASMVPGLHCSTTESRGELEDATHQGHNALSRYRKHAEKQDLECSIEEFERAFSVCPHDHPCRAVVQSNLAMAKFILCHVDETDTSLEVPLALYRDVLAARPIGHIDRSTTLIQLATVHFARFEKWKDEVDRVWAEGLLNEVVRCTSVESHANRAATFLLQLYARCTLGPVLAHDKSSPEQDSGTRLMVEDLRALSVQLLHVFEQCDDLADLQQAIAILEELVKFTPDLDDRHCAELMNLSVALQYRFDRLGALGDPEKAISMFEIAVDLIPHTHPDRVTCLSNLGNSFFTRFKRHGELNDLEHAISRHRDAVKLTCHGHPDKPAYLNNLGSSSCTRFMCFGELSDLEEAISRHRDAVDLIPHSHPDKPACLSNLGGSLSTRFLHLGELGDLDEAISTLSGAVDLTPLGHPEKPGHLGNLGSAFKARFERHGELSDLEYAISRNRDAVDLTPNGHPGRPTYLNALGGSLKARFEHLGELSDLQRSILVFRDAVNFTPHDHPDKPHRLSNLGIAFKARFLRLGELSDLEDSISRHRDAQSWQLPPHSLREKPDRLCNLSNSFKARFDRLGELNDLEEAIAVLRVAIYLLPHGHPHEPAYLSNLGNGMFARFLHLGELKDLEDAISTLKDAVGLTPHGHPDKPGRLNNLGNSLNARFKSLKERRDLEDAISNHQHAVDLTPQAHLGKPHFLSSLGNSFVARFEHLGELSDLEHAISCHKDAVDLTPRGHPYKPVRLNNLGYSLNIRFQHLGEPSNLEQAISIYSYAASAPTGLIADRFHASQQWISCACHIRHHTLFRAYSGSISLLPRLAWIGLSLTYRYFGLTRGSDVVREAAAAALDAGLPEIAVEWLEQGRSIVWGELLQLRGSYDELSSAYPDHARRLQELSVTLERASANREKSLSASIEQSGSAAYCAIAFLRQESDWHRMIAIERDKLLQEIRAFPSFEHFLLHKDFTQLRPLAHSGPVVILNAAESRCDALIILADLDHVVHVPLPNFNFQRSAGLQNMLEKLLGHARDIHHEDRKGDPATRSGISWQSLLSTLWNAVVKPVLEALAFSTPGDLSRIFWCPTGPFMFLPIHAAGIYGTMHSEPGHKLFDFVISSYIPTLSILALSSSPGMTPNSDLRLLAVRQPPSDGLPRLPGVAIELEHIKDIISNSSSSHTILLESSEGTVEEVLALMKEGEWVHFACHGMQDTGNPTNSGLCLADGRRLKLRDIISLSRPHGGLAFLSACQTAMGDDRLSDEAMHITAGMLFAGYGGVVGTMWSISDKVAPRVAKDVYGQLFRNGGKPDYREAAWALHNAIWRLRDSNASFVEWIPFIHVGL